MMRVLRHNLTHEKLVENFLNRSDNNFEVQILHTVVEKPTDMFKRPAHYWSRKALFYRLFLLKRNKQSQ